jgi:uncharacterized membrane protein YcfT
MVSTELSIYRTHRIFCSLFGTAAASTMCDLPKLKFSLNLEIAHKKFPPTARMTICKLVGNGMTQPVTRPRRNIQQSNYN